MTSLETLASLVQPGRYDAVVRIDLFTDVYDWNKGWKMALAANYERVLENCPTVRVAPIGVFNVGKTWLIKKLCGEPGDSGLLSGESRHTEGLSIKVSQLPGDTDRFTAFLDTAGLNSPVTSVRSLGHMLGIADSDPMKAMDNMLQELKRHENFIRQVAFEYAQVYLLVVGQISHRDQLELLQLVQLAEKHGAKKQVIVVHNLKNMTYKEFTTAAKYDSFTPEAPPMTYLQVMQNVYKLEVNHPTLTSHPGATIDELYSKFGDGDRAVQIRHLFITREVVVASGGSDEKPLCKNDLVFEYMRTLIRSSTPITSNILADIAKIATDCAKSMVRLPPGKNIEIRFHKRRGVLLGGEVTEAEAKQMADWAKQPPKSDEVAQAEAKVAEYKLKADKGPLTDEERVEMEAADAHLSLTLVQARGNVIAPARDAETLVPLKSAKGEITCRPVALGATTVMSGDGHVKYNVSRVRAMVNGQPYWMVCVHLTIPGLAPGELKKLRQTLRWEEGLTMAPETPQAVDTLQLQFKVAIANSPAKQLEALNRAGAPVRTTDQRTLGGAIRIEAAQTPVVVEAGNRPFPTPAATVGPAKESNGTYVLDVLVHTKVENCSWEIEPILSYSRGVLTVMVCAEPSEDERAVPENRTWIEEGCGVFDFGEYVKNTGGSEDDLAA